MSTFAAVFHVVLVLMAGLFAGLHIKSRRYEMAGLWIALGLMQLAVYVHAVWSQS